MTSLALIAALAAAAPADGMVQPRRAYEDCMRKLAESELKAKAEPTKFEVALGSACASQEAALKSAIIAHYVGLKSPRKEAEQSAVDWVTDIRETTKERYKSDFEATSPPST